MDNSRTSARSLANQYLESGEPLGWFEELYDGVQGDPAGIPWADCVPNPNLTDWLELRSDDSIGRRALVVGCGLGDDAEFLAQRGYQVTAFDVSGTAIEWCRRRFPDSQVDYVERDLFAPVTVWEGQFDFVFEAYTLQVLPEDLQHSAIEKIADFVAPCGTLLVISRGREQSDDPGSMPWPLTREQITQFRNHGLHETQFEDYWDQEDPPVRRFRVTFRRAENQVA